ncbi:MAG: hypothetical protein JXQ23_11160 [Clostridia bacterium]|nr:hypothetical protein [Clostridia bacterium]
MESISSVNSTYASTFDIDNAGKLYPIIDPKKRTSLFSLSLTMKEKVNDKILERALLETLTRFPVFNVKLRKNFFWHYFVSNDKSPVITQGELSDNLFIDKKLNNEFLFKVIYSENKISLIIFHALTDGAGAMVFVKALMNEYIKILGKNVFQTESIPKHKEKADQIFEGEDSFKKFYKNWKNGMKTKSKAYHFNGLREDSRRVNITVGTMKVEDLLKVTREKDVTVTTYLTALYIYVLQNLQLSENRRRLRPIRIQVPINLRTIYPSKTLRNFSSYVIPELKTNRGEYSFSEIIDEVHHFFKLEINKRKLTAQFSDNVRMENNPVIRRLPLFIKKPITLYISYQLGQKCQSGTLSNIGKVELPEYMTEYINKYEAILVPGKMTHSSCALASYNNEIHIAFSRTIKESTLESMFFSELIKNGINTKIEVF